MLSRNRLVVGRQFVRVEKGQKASSSGSRIPEYMHRYRFAFGDGRSAYSRSLCCYR
jgi:hypothetical protein